MKIDKKLAVVCYTEFDLGGRGWRGVDCSEGEPKREKILCSNIPEALYCLFGGKNLGDLERLVYDWAGAGGGERFAFPGKFLKKEGGWLEDLEVKMLDLGGGEGWDSESDIQAKTYAEDILSFLRIPVNKNS